MNSKTSSPDLNNSSSVEQNTPLSENYLNSFAGIGRLYGQDSLKTLAAAKVAVIGLGGVGSWAAEALARSGIGHLALFDLDDICQSNINRQLHALNGSIGQSKVVAMAERLQQINPEAEILAQQQFITLKNLDSSLQGFNVILDAIDEASIKAGLIAWARGNKQPLVVVGGAGGKLDPRQITTGDLAFTTQDPLLAKVRNLLRKNYGFAKEGKKKFKVECIYSTEQLNWPQPDGSISKSKPKLAVNRLDCATGFGAATFVTGSFGFFAAQRCVNKLLKI